MPRLDLISGADGRPLLVDAEALAREEKAAREKRAGEEALAKALALAERRTLAARVAQVHALVVESEERARLAKIKAELRELGLEIAPDATSEQITAAVHKAIAAALMGAKGRK